MPMIDQGCRFLRHKASVPLAWKQRAPSLPAASFDTNWRFGSERLKTQCRLSHPAGFLPAASGLYRRLSPGQQQIR